MKEFIKLIKEYGRAKNKKAYLFVISERSRKLQVPNYSLFQLLNSAIIEPGEIISSEGWIANDINLQQEKIYIEKEKTELINTKIKLEIKKKENLFLKKYYLIIPAILVVLLIVFVIALPLFNSAEEEKLWDKVCVQNTMSSYENYINQYPEGKHINEALIQKDKSQEREEELLWNEAVKINTQKSYLSYINNSNEAKYKKKAMERLDEMAIQEIKKVFFSWINCWQDRDIECFKSFISYDYNYETATGDKKNQSQNRSKRLSNLEGQFNERSFIKITVINIKIDLLEEGKAIIHYSQKYESNSWSDKGLKTIYLKLMNDEWKIYRDIFK